MIMGDNDEIDFEKINSIDGTFIANRYTPPEQRQSLGTYSNFHDAPVYSEEEMSSLNIFEEADMVAEEARKAKMQGKGVEVVNYNRKQRETNLCYKKVNI